MQPTHTDIPGPAQGVVLESEPSYWHYNTKRTSSMNNYRSYIKKCVNPRDIVTFSTWLIMGAPLEPVSQ